MKLKKQFAMYCAAFVALIFLSAPLKAELNNGPNIKKNIFVEPENQKFLINISGRGSLTQPDPLTIQLTCRSTSSCLCAQVYTNSPSGAVARIYLDCHDLPDFQFNFNTYTNDQGFDEEGQPASILNFYGCTNIEE